MNFIDLYYVKWRDHLERKVSRRVGRGMSDFISTGLHFDRPISFSKILTNTAPNIISPDAVARKSFYPLLRTTMVSKKTKKVDQRRVLRRKRRPICFASHSDTLIFSWYAFILSGLYEKKIQGTAMDKSVIGYRSLGMSTVDHALSLFDRVLDGGTWQILAMDVKDFYGSMSHDRIKDYWSSLIDLERLPDDHFRVFQATTRPKVLSKSGLKNAIQQNNIKTPMGMLCRVGDAMNLRREQKIGWVSHSKSSNSGFGIPQGIATSPVLSNLYMYDFDKTVSLKAERIGGIYFRYADDIIIAVKSSDVNIIDELEEFVGMSIKNIGLTVASSKTQKCIVELGAGSKVSIKRLDSQEKSFDYLGIVLTSDGIRVRQRTLTKFGHRLRRSSWRVSHGRQELKDAKKKSYLHATNRHYLKTVQGSIQKLDLIKVGDPNYGRVLERAKMKLSCSAKRSRSLRKDEASE